MRKTTHLLRTVHIGSSGTLKQTKQEKKKKLLLEEEKLNGGRRASSVVSLNLQNFGERGGSLIIKTYQFSEQHRYHCVLSPFAVKFCEITQ